jgi:S-(hydroxymethyl)glutathione dehydrogenase/alcohol dehydrogenase
VRAAVLVEYGQPLAIEDIAPPKPGPRDVVIKVGASGICHSDLSVQQGLFKGFTSASMILGHEGAGTVIEIGSEVSRVAVGDRVIGSFRPACGVCYYCLHDESHLCEALPQYMSVERGRRPNGDPVIAMSGLGTFSEIMTCNEGSVVRVATDIPDQELALLGCGLTTGVGAVLNTAQVKPGETVAVVGCGGVGQSVVQGARVAGAARIIAIDPIESKRKTALQFGATDVVDPTQGNVQDQIRELTGGRGTDYTFDVVGTPTVVAQSFQTIRKGGTLVLVGYGPMGSELPLNLFDIQGQGKTIVGCVAGSSQIRRDFQRYVDLITTGRLDTSSMVSETIDLSQVNVAMGAMDTGEGIRSVITSF